MALAITCPTSSGNVLDTASNGPIRLLGWSVRKGAGACTVDLNEGSSSGKIVASINLAASGGDTQWFGSEGVMVDSDILYATVAGTTTGLVGSIWVG